MPTAEERRDELKRVYVEASDCTRCPALVEGRSTVVFGSGHPDADLLLVATAPGRADDEQGLPVVGPSGTLLSELLEEIGLDRSQVYVTTMVKCRPPGNREPLPAELAACRGYLERQVQLVRPRVVCTLGNFATRLLREDPTGVTEVHGRVEPLTLGGVPVRLLPLFHPAAALYAKALLALPAPDAPPDPEPVVEPEPEPAPPPEPEDAPGPEPEPDPPDDGGQLGLF